MASRRSGREHSDSPFSDIDSDLEIELSSDSDKPTTSTKAKSHEQRRKKKESPPDRMDDDESDDDGCIDFSDEKLQKVLKELACDNPGQKFAAADLFKKKRRNRKQYKNQRYTPHHDHRGRFVKDDGTAVRICDCLDTKCEGCHFPCSECGSGMCSFKCQVNRTTIVLSAEVVDVSDTEQLNPFYEDSQPDHD
ncbi:hypothetical protein AAVH_01047 [Aphelenchoides avenae]|nr:hypothetical protein AAVH_01047 [Aphelenchus avenae]